VREALPLGDRNLLVVPSEDDEKAQLLVACELVLGACRDERRLPLVERGRLAADRQLASSPQDDVELVVGVRALVVWLGGGEDVDTHLEAGGGVDDLVAAVGRKPTPCLFDVEWVHRLPNTSGDPGTSPERLGVDDRRLTAVELDDTSLLLGPQNAIDRRPGGRRQSGDLLL
jgi:hypothetical protein